MVARKSVESGPARSTRLERVSDREFIIERTFNGPPHIVFDAWTRPELVKRWWAPESFGCSVVSCEADVRVGGTYRYVIQPSTGEAVAFSGEYTEITPHSRLVYTSVFEAMRDAGAAIVTVTFEEDEGRTHLVSREQYPSKQALDAAIASGMEDGARVTMDQLEALVNSLAMA